MKEINATVVSVFAADSDADEQQPSAIQLELDGIVGSHHRSYTRKSGSGDKQAKGTLRRNERQWSAVSVEELSEIQKSMGLEKPLTAKFLLANLCIEGLAELSRLPKGTLLKFPSGAELIVEEYNPPCRDMGQRLADSFKTQSDESLSDTAFPKAAKLLRGVVGTVEVAGTISVGDVVTVVIYENPPWLKRSS